MKEKIYHWLDSFENCNQQYIIMPTESYYSYFPEGSRYIRVRTPTGFINQENGTIYYFNETIQLLCVIGIFRPLIINIDWDNMMSCLNK